MKQCLNLGNLRILEPYFAVRIVYFRGSNPPSDQPPPSTLFLVKIATFAFRGKEVLRIVSLIILAPDKPFYERHTCTVVSKEVWSEVPQSIKQFGPEKSVPERVVLRTTADSHHQVSPPNEVLQADSNCLQGTHLRFLPCGLSSTCNIFKTTMLATKLQSIL